MRKLPFVFGFLSPVFYFSLLTILGNLWIGYNPITTGMSEIGAVNSPYQDIMNYFGFSLLGISIMIFSFGYWKLFKKNLVLKIAATLLTLSGLFLFVVGFLPCDTDCIDATTTGKLHSLVSTVPAILMPVAAILSANQLFKLLGNRIGFASFLLGILSLTSGPLMFLPDLESYTGLIQRSGIGFSMLWMMIVSYVILKKMEKRKI